MTCDVLQPPAEPTPGHEVTQGVGGGCKTVAEYAAAAAAAAAAASASDRGEITAS